MSIQKPVVHYVPDPDDFIELGKCAFVSPVDHPSPNVSNTTLVQTSRVVSIHEGGTFETLNTIYKRKE